MRRRKLCGRGFSVWRIEKRECIEIMHAEMMKPESEGRREGKMAESGGGKRTEDRGRRGKRVAAQVRRGYGYRGKYGEKVWRR